MRNNQSEILHKGTARLVGFCGFETAFWIDDEGLVAVSMKPTGDLAPQPWRSPASEFEGALANR
jgi:hypothetical protein